jgi:hypothetical protein
MVLYTEEQLRKAWIEHLISMYLLETESGLDTGNYPELEEFRVMFEEEMEANPELI